VSNFFPRTWAGLPATTSPHRGVDLAEIELVRDVAAMKLIGTQVGRGADSLV